MALGTVLLGMKQAKQAVAAACIFSPAVGLKDGWTWRLASVSTGFGKNKMKWGASCFAKTVFSLCLVKGVLPPPKYHFKSVLRQGWLISNSVRKGGQGVGITL